MRVLKFGGTSISSLKCFSKVVNIIKKNYKKDQIAVVLSAPKKVTDNLFYMIEKSCQTKDIKEIFNNTKDIFFYLIKSLFDSNENYYYLNIYNFIELKFNRLLYLLNIVFNLKFCPNSINAEIVCMGEIISVKLMELYLKNKNIDVFVIDPKKIFLSKGQYLESFIDIKESERRIKKINFPKNKVILMAGFIAKNKYGELVALGRNGSDYSATALAACLKANVCEIWTDVDGIYTGDPNKIKNTKLINKLSCKEAISLSYLGAEILHKRSIFPILEFNIPCIIKNTNNSNSYGTSILNIVNDEKEIIKGITFLKDIAMISIFICYNIKTINIYNRILVAFKKSNIKIIFMMQSSSESNINIFIFQNNLSESKCIIEYEFCFEINNKLFESIHYKSDLFILSMIGSNIFKNKNIFINIVKFFNFIHKKMISILYGGYLSNAFSVVLESCNIVNDLNNMHKIFFEKKNFIEIFIIGNKNIKNCLFNLFYKKKFFFKKKHIELKICGISDAKKLLINENGINLKHWKYNLSNSKIIFDSDIIIECLKKNNFLNPVIVDCTQNKIISKKYADFLIQGFHIVTSNKQPNISSIDYYKKIRNMSIISNKKFLYNANFNTQFPIIENIKSFLNLSENKNYYFSGVLSSAISFIFERLNKGMSFYKIIVLALQSGFSLKDIYHAILGKDSAENLLIIARELGYNIEIKDIEIKPIISKKFLKKNIKKEIFNISISVDNKFKKKLQKAKIQGNVLNYVSNIKNGKFIIKIQEASPNNPLFKVKSKENIFIFYTNSHKSFPIILKSFSYKKNIYIFNILNDLLKLT
ncbi:thrA [Wigglesworthia glossinidia endosymbiont of Glossina brevipalpis]|uniref:Bifunctional aspartokinase/homoserine dehydrogenase n=1 Tax=Wigglesworthia glossinidia brevipalpis TaxID=36870 RepID=Q8D1W5_WIGBR|nr:thrA [Wigglesworthia glossinidia endosymbiont of Glossina brevipalpis]